MKERLRYLEGPFRDEDGQEWRGLVPAVAVLLVLAFIDYSFEVAMIGIFALAPFLCAIVGARSATLAVSILTLVMVLISATWNDNFGEADFWIRALLVVGACAFALYAAWMVDENRRIVSERVEVAGILEQGLRPPKLPQVAGWSIAALYRPAGDGNAVGGDFYDIFRIENGWMIVIGDVTGHGPRAASITALARFTLRSSAARTGEPADAFSELNKTLIAEEQGPLCTVAALTLGSSPDDAVKYATAGHPPGLRIKNDGTVEPISASGPVLGAFEGSNWESDALKLQRGELLLLYTDGVTEARRKEELFGQDRLAEAAANSTSPDDAIDKVDRAITHFNSGDLSDDAAVLAIMRTGAANEPDTR